MRNIFNFVKTAAKAVKSKISAVVTAVRTAAFRLAVRSNTMLAETRAENFVDSGIKILIAVVIGALLLGGLYALFGATRCCDANAKRAARTPPNNALA